MNDQELATPQRTREDWHGILRSRGIQPTRSMGQNFLVEPEVVHVIAETANIQPGVVVMEIGPGLGILTRELLGRGAKVIAVELDRDLVQFLKGDLMRFPDLTLVERDGRYVEIETWIGDRTYQLVANLPYSTGTAMVRRFLELDHPPTTITVMVQREVAERMIADPPGMSLLGLATQLYATGEIAAIVPPNVFLPPPKVESAIIHLELRAEPLASPIERTMLFKLATMAFQRKRKTLSNGLSQGLGVAKCEVDARLESADIDPARRPQSLSLGDWITVAKAFTT